MLHVVLFQPDIPQNTGNIGRTCAITGARLHLIHPLGFEISDRTLKRSGLDYWKDLDVVEHDDWEAFEQAPCGPRRLWLMTTRANNTLWSATFAADDGFVFGKETSGAPPWLHEKIGHAHTLKIPQPQPALRSLNLSVAVGVTVYEGLRQLDS